MSKTPTATLFPDSREKRWLVITEAGEHSTIGRHTDPTGEELAEITKRLDGLSVAGWLAVSEGIYHGSGEVTLLLVRRLSRLHGNWEAASERWHAKRRDANR